MSTAGDKLEEEGKLEICGACKSLNLIEIKGKAVCNTCGTKRFHNYSKRGRL